MKSRKLFFGLFTALILLMTSANNLLTKEDGTPIKNGVGYTGGFAEQGRTCGVEQCHHVIGGGNISQRDSMIIGNVPDTVGYYSGNTYQFSVTVADPFRVKYGYMASPQDINGDKAGSLAIIDDSSQLRFGGVGPDYIAITHTEIGNQGPNETKTWHFNWTAPSQTGLGDVYFFVACNASNNDDTTLGDRIYLDTLILHEALNNGVNDLMSQGFHASISSNPVRGDAIISLAASHPVMLEYGVTDIHGRFIVPFRDLEIEKEHVLRIPLEQRPPGTYLVVFRSGGHSSVLRIMKC